MNLTTKPKYTACITTEEGICHFGQGHTPDEAVNDFVNSGAFYDECGDLDLPFGSMATVEVWTTIYKGDNGSFNQEEYDDDFDWYLGDFVESRKIEVCE